MSGGPYTPAALPHKQGPPLFIEWQAGWAPIEWQADWAPIEWQAGWAPVPGLDFLGKTNLTNSCRLT
jgi:hypothetical protein